MSTEPIWAEEDIAEAKGRLASDEPCYTTEQIQAHLRALKVEWERTGGFDKQYLEVSLDRLRAEDAR